MRGIGIVGRKRVGKDTAAQVLRDEYGFTRVGFADQVKALALVTNPVIRVNPYGGWPIVERLADVVDRIGWERAKDDYPEVRAFLQRHGDGSRRVLGDTVWLDAWQRRAEVVDGPVVVPDVRYLNEAARLRSLGFTIVRVTRPGMPDDGDTHVSETEQDGIAAHVEFRNDGTVGDLAAHMRTLAEWTARLTA